MRPSPCTPARHAPDRGPATASTERGSYDSAYCHPYRFLEIRPPALRFTCGCCARRWGFKLPTGRSRERRKMGLVFLAAPNAQGRVWRAHPQGLKHTVLGAGMEGLVFRCAKTGVRTSHRVAGSRREAGMGTGIREWWLGAGGVHKHPGAQGCPRLRAPPPQKHQVLNWRGCGCAGCCGGVWRAQGQKAQQGRVGLPCSPSTRNCLCLSLAQLGCHPPAPPSQGSAMTTVPTLPDSPIPTSYCFLTTLLPEMTALCASPGSVSPQDTGILLSGH